MKTKVLNTQGEKKKEIDLPICFSGKIREDISQKYVETLKKIQPLVAAHSRFIADIDPYEKLKNVAPKPLFMMNCDFDTDQPKIYSIYAYRDLFPFYQSHPQNIKLRIYPAGHEVTPQMEEEAVDWFCDHLLD